MAPEIGNAEVSPRETSPIQKREQRVHSYMMRFNATPKEEVYTELNQLVAKGNEFPSSQYKLAKEVESVLNSNKLVVDEKIVSEYGEKLESRREAEDAMVALLYDIQTPLHGKNMHIAPSDLPKLLKILEDTRERRSSRSVFDETMVNSKDQAILFLTQAYFYGGREQGKKTIYIEGDSNDEVEIENLVPKFNMYLPEEDKIIIKHKELFSNIPGVTYFSPEGLSQSSKSEEQQKTVKEEENKPHSPIKTAAEKKRAEEIEGIFGWSERRMEFDLNNPDSPISLDITPLWRERSSIGEVFGTNGKGNINVFSLLSMTSQEASKSVVNWLMSEKRMTKRMEKIQGITSLADHLFHEILSPETKKEFDKAFAEDVLSEDGDLTRLHKRVVESVPQRSKEDAGMNNMEQLIVEAAERLFLLKQAHVLGDEIRQEIQARRKAVLGGAPIDAEGESSAKDIEDILKKIEAQIGHPVDQNTPIQPYEMNVYFPPISSVESHDPYDSSVPVLMTKMMNGEKIDGKLFQLDKKTLCGYVLSLCIEKWSHQARSVQVLRQEMPPSEVENAGHYMPYKVEDVKDERGYSEKVQTYFIHDNTPDSNDPNKGCLYVDSQTHLSVPVEFEKPKKEGDNMHIEYVYGLYGQIPGIKEKKVNT